MTWPAFQNSTALIIDHDNAPADVQFRLENTNVPIQLVYMHREIETKEIVAFLHMILQHPVHVKSIEYILIQNAAKNDEVSEGLLRFPNGAANMEKFVGC